MEFKFEDFNIGDILEFHHFHWDGNKHTQQESIYVDRISSLIKNIGKSGSKDPHPEEIWFEHYGEMPGALYVTPDNVVRIVEKGNGPKWSAPSDPTILPLGTLVKHEGHGKGKVTMDRIVGQEIYVAREESRTQYFMEFSEYVMGSDEFEVVTCG